MRDAHVRCDSNYETASEKYGWLDRIVAVAVGRFPPNVVGYKVYAVL